MKFTRLAVLNRGDAAMRCMRTVREMAEGEGPILELVAVFTDPDENAPFVRLADHAISLGAALQPTPSGAMLPAYCHHDLVIERLVEAQIEAVWPGWGFVSEDADFVDRLTKVGIAFIGPSAEAMRKLGDKVQAKKLAETCGVPLAPWAELDLDADPSEWERVAAQVGLPVMVKAANGGGGRGIRRVDDLPQMAIAVRSVRAEATASFGEGAVFVERCVEDARHIEVQFVVGVDGRAQTLGLRDCTIQRRHQKVIEEAPSPVLSPVEEERLTESTAKLVEAAGYRGVGTAEFLYVPATRTASFCEVNARLQVEHTVTEMVWGVDLVRAQIEIALGTTHERSSGPRGWAIEARIVAEDAERGFAAAPGKVLVHRPAAGPNVRVDAGIRAGSEIPIEFDSMIAKVLAWGPTRDRAIATLVRAVREYEVLIEDGATNRGVLLDILSREELLEATATTTWLESVDDLGAQARAAGTVVALVAAAVQLASADRLAHANRFFSDARSGVPAADGSATRPFEVELSLRGIAHQLSVCRMGGTRWSVGPIGRELDVLFERLDESAVVVTVAGRSQRVLLHSGSSGVTVDVDGTLHRVQLAELGVVRSPGPALVVEISVAVGEVVTAGQRIGILEAMKTEAPLLAEIAGEVERIVVPAGSQVTAGEAVVVLRPFTDDSGLHAGTCENQKQTVVFDTLWPRTDLGSAQRTEQVLKSVLLGYEVPAHEVATAEAALDQVARCCGLSDLQQRYQLADWIGLLDHLQTFVDTEALLERNLILLDDHTAVISAELAFHDLCRKYGDPRAAVVTELVPLVDAVLLHYGLTAASEPQQVRDALWRIAATRARLAERENLMISAVRAIAAFVRTEQLEGSEFLSRLAAVEHVATGALTALADAAVLVRAELGTARGEVHSVAPESVDIARLLALTRYVDVQITVVDAVVTDAGQSVVSRVVSNTDPTDSRMVLTIDLHQAPEDISHLSEEQIAPFAELFDVGVALLRTRREQHRSLSDRDTWWAALHLLLHGTRTGDPGSMLSLTHKFESGTRGLALQEFTIALLPNALPPNTALTGTVLVNPEMQSGVVEFSIRRRGHARLEIDSSQGMLQARPRSNLDRRALTAKRLGVVDPWELIGLLEGRVRDGDLPHPSLADGRFIEYDLDPSNPGPSEKLCAVNRPPALHECSVIVGLVANPLVGRTEWAERVLILGDPLRSMGSLGQEECRRILGALELAAERNLRVEWVSLSSGARIAWDSGTENLDWTAAVLRRIVEFTTAGGEIDVIVSGVNVGAQSYWNAEATMLMHTKGILIMLPTSSMVLTGKRALEFSGSVGAQDEIGIGGHDRVMGPNGQSQYRADDVAAAYAILLDHHGLTLDSVHSGTPGAAPRINTDDPATRNICLQPYSGGDEGFTMVGEIFDTAINPGRKRPFAVRAVMGAVVDAEAPRLERWRGMADADGAVVWETRIGGFPVSLIGIESRPRQRSEPGPIDGPTEWAGGTLYPASSKKVARAIRAASANRAAVILANLSGFDGSPESLRRLQLEYGAEIARAVVEFDGPIVFVVIGRYHGGAYVVFSKRLNEGLTSIALEGSFASVIGGAPAAAVVLTRDVRTRIFEDQQIQMAQLAVEQAEAGNDADLRLQRLEELKTVRVAATARARTAVAREFDAIHTVERAVQVGSLDAVIPAAELRPRIIEVLEQRSESAG